MMYLIFAVIPYFILRLLFLKKTAERWLYFCTHYFCKFILFLTGVKLSIKADSKSAELFSDGKAVCLVSNHTSMLDIPAVLYATGAKAGFVTKYVLAFVPVLNLFALALGCVFIDRKNRKRSVRSIKRGCQKIKNGHSMLIFPEGTRSKTGKIAPFKHGAFRLAIDADAYIVPVTLKGLRQAFEDRQRVLGKYEAFCSIGEPVKIDINDSRETRFEKIEAVEKSIRETYASLGDR